MQALVDLIADIPADNSALVLPESDFRLTYGTLKRRVEILAGDLANARVRRGDRVAIAVPNGPALVIALLAASTIGAAMPIDPPDDEGRFDARSVILPANSPEGIPRVHMTDATPKGSDPGSDPLADSSIDDIAVVLKTRGTTGPPKRVGLSHANLSIAATGVATTLGLGAGDVTLCVMPLTHVHGFVSATLATLATGGTVVIPTAFHPLSFWRVARDYGVTWFTATPLLHQWLLARTADPGARRPAGAARLRFIRSAGEMLPQTLRETLESAFGVPVVEAYEVTEAAGEVASTSVRPGALRPHAARIAILDTAGRQLEPGTRGEVALAGPTMARGYEADPEATRRFFVDGWFRTGDFGYLDDGQLTLIRD